MKSALKAAVAPEPDILPNLVTHVASHDAALQNIIAAMERELSFGRQFYAMPVSQVWGVFYNGAVAVH